MEGNNKNGSGIRFSAGVTLVELMITLAIVSVLYLVSITAIDASWQLSQINRVKAYLLSAQAIQSRSWLESGIYLPLEKMPAADIQEVSFKQTINSKVGYEITATLKFKSTRDSCYKIIISETTLAPKSCW
ncbi:type IV pilin protein [Alteromonas gracilis]|uniref:type IV pilin protein n=1 Tax=Alteromonas gracilis TaxID=1479524 RepID=UPI00373645E0